MKGKIVVVHAGRRDDYQLALALNECNMLQYLVTDFYAPIDYSWFRALKAILPNKIIAQFSKRYKNGLESQKVIICWRAFFYSIIYSFTKNIKYSLLKDKSLGIMANKIAKKNKSHIVSMNTYANYAFKGIKQLKVLFQFHPHPTFVKKQLKEEIALNDQYATSLLKEYEFSLSKNELDELSKEIWLADNILCASSITKDSITSEGIDTSKLQVVPYGVDTSKYEYKEREVPKDKFRVIFIGSLNQRKGISYLLEALSQMNNIELIIVGRGIFDMSLIENYNFEIKIFKDVPFEELLSLLHSSHCFVLPSIIEGFGQVILEAMASGVPVVASENTIGRDIISHKEDGFLVPIRDVNAIKIAIEQLQNNPDLINLIGYKGHMLAKSLTWSKFRNMISKTTVKWITMKNN